MSLKIPIEVHPTRGLAIKYAELMLKAVVKDQEEWILVK
jgi:hypothetical protein